MNYIKKAFLFLIILFACSLFGCKEKIEDKTDKEVLDEFVQTITFDEKLEDDLPLKTEYTYGGKTIEALWETSNEKILTAEGKYYPTFADLDVSLNCTFTLNNEIVEMTYDFISYESTKCFEKAYNEMNKNIETSTSIELDDYVLYGKYRLELSYTSSNTDVMDNEGKLLSYAKTDRNITISVTFSYKTYTYTNDINVLIKAFDSTALQNSLKEIAIPSTIDDSITLPKAITYSEDEFLLTWSSSNENILDNNGNVNPQSTTSEVELTVTTILDISYTFKIQVTPISDQTLMQKVLDEITIPELVTYDIYLPNSYDYQTSATWSSSNTSLLSNDGKITNNITKYTDIELTLTLNKGDEKMTKTYNITVGNENHFFQDRTFNGEKENVEIENGKLVLSDTALTGTYTTPIINTDDFVEAVASYAATSSKNATCELQVRVQSNNTWSKYFSYGVWGQGLTNSAYNQTDTYVSLDTDEILLNGANVGTAFQIKLILKRDNINTTSPIVSVIALAINFKNYTYEVDITSLPNKVLYDVPCLYQHDVPSIGSIICSATSSTMLLKYKGYDFTAEADYEHQYIASIVKDSGHNIYGNWVYNTIGMSSFGEIAYVKRFYSANEMIYNLATIGPMAASIKGTTITDKKTYTTNGHLIVVKGYEIKDGQTLIYINDPNVSGVSVTMTLENFLNVYRMVSYVIE